MRHDERFGSGFRSQLRGLGRVWLVVLHDDRRDSLLGGRVVSQLERVGFDSQLERFDLESQLILDFVWKPGRGFGLQLETDSQLGPESQLERFGLKSQLDLGLETQIGGFGAFGLQLGTDSQLGRGFGLHSTTDSQLGSGSKSDSQKARTPLKF